MEMKLSQAFLWSALLLLVGSVAVHGDKQANGSRGIDVLSQTRPAVPALHGMVVAGHPLIPLLDNTTKDSLKFESQSQHGLGRLLVATL
jgi:hypothetical protein